MSLNPKNKGGIRCPLQGKETDLVVVIVPVASEAVEQPEKKTLGTVDLKNILVMQKAIEDKIRVVKYLTTLFYRYNINE